MKRILIIAPHLSTGGQPQYLLAHVKGLQGCYDVGVVEYAFIAPAYIVQRDRLRALLPEDRFWSLGQDKNELLNIIAGFQPDIVHWEEIPEDFCDPALAAQVYRPERSYLIIETTHTSSFDVKSRKQFFPDKFMFVCEWSRRQYEHLGIPADVVEYPLEPRERPNRAEALTRLGLDPNRKHVLNVGLFTPGKNQGEAFELARRLPEVSFHFVGNQAPNFQAYWEPLLRNTPPNCRLWGERNDTDAFYSACDLFLFTSICELCPIVLKEALSWNLPILMHNLVTYCDSYTEGPRLRFLTKDIDQNSATLRKMLSCAKEFKTRTDPVGRRGDLGIINAVYTEDEYGLEALQRSGVDLHYVLDVGGHIGSFGAKVKELWPDAKVIAFEPNPESSHLYQQNVEAMIVPYAVSYDAGKTCLADDVECPGSGVLIKPDDLRSDGTFLTDAASFAGREHRISVKGVKTVTLEQVLKGFEGQIDLLKLDCEGSEIDILQNLSDGIAQKVKRIVGEYHYGAGFQAFANLVKAKFPDFEVIQTREYTSSRGGFAASKRQLPKVRLVHMLCMPDRETEKRSIASLSVLANYGIDYVQQINPRATQLPALEPLFPTGQWGQPLRPEYYGVWAAHRRAFEEGFSQDTDFLMVCEGDCFLEVPPETFVQRLRECTEVIEKEGLFYFSFGEAVDPISGARQSEVIREIGAGAFLTGKIIRCHCVLFPKAAREFWFERFRERKWYSADIWYNAILQNHGKPMGIVKDRLASQQDDRRESLLDEKH